MNRQADDESFGIYPREIAAMLYRRMSWIVAAATLGLLLAGIAAYVQRPQYRSSATLLIDSPQVPTSLVASPLTNIANERIAKIRQQIVSHDSLSALIRRNDLYRSERANMPFPNVLDTMRGAIGVDLVGADQTRGSGTTIAFTLTFTYHDPATAQAVTQQLTEKFLAADKRFRTEQATGTAAFLERRSEELRRQLAALENSRRDVEARYAGALPTNVALSAQSSSALRAEISRTDAETQGLIQQGGLLAARAREFAQTPPAGVEALRRAEERLAQLVAVYADDYPEVRAARAAVERQRDLLGRLPAASGENLIEREIAAGRERIAVLAARRAELVHAMTQIDDRAAQAPQAAFELNRIEREYDNIKRQYETLREKHLDAQVAANLQAEDKGERFTVVDEPSMPHESLGTRKLVLLLTGLAGGAAAGAMAVLAHAFATGTIHGTSTLTRLMGAAPIGIIGVADRSHGPTGDLAARLVRLGSFMLPWRRRTHAG